MTYSVRNWARFQHYTKRHPPWIKLYHDLLDDDEFAALDHFTQLLYFKLLMAASRKDNRIPEDPTWMATELSMPRRRVRQAVSELLASGFLASTDASDPASKRASGGASGIARASRAPARSREPEAEAEQEAETDPKAVVVDHPHEPDPDDEPELGGAPNANGTAPDLTIEEIMPTFREMPL